MRIMLMMCLISILVSCSAIKDRYYHFTFSDTDILEAMNVGDSIRIHFGDSIKFKYHKNRESQDQGNVLIVKNRYGNYEFYEYGIWKIYDYYGRQQSIFVYDLELGLKKEKAWNYYADSASILCDNYRTVQNDSIYEFQKWYYPNGELEKEITYLIKRSYNKRRRHLERRKKINQKEYYSNEGKRLKRKYFGI